MTHDEACEWVRRHIGDNPQPLIDAMVAAGWKVIGGRAGYYTRLALPDGERRSVIVPLDPVFADYADDIAATVRDLDRAAHHGRRAQQVLDALTGAEGGTYTERITALEQDIDILAPVGRLYLDALDADPANEALTLVEAYRVTEVRDAVERAEARP